MVADVTQNISTAGRLGVSGYTRQSEKLNQTNQMKAFTKTKYGGPEILQLEEVEKPSLKDDRILIKVIANSANPADWHILRGNPFFARFSFGLFKPKDNSGS